MPTTNAIGIHAGASNVISTHRRKYAEMVIIRRRVGDTEVECENAKA